MKRATKMRQTASSASSLIVSRLKVEMRDGARTDQSTVKERQLESLEESRCFSSKDGLRENLEKLLKMNMSDSSRMLFLKLQ